MTPDFQNDPKTLVSTEWLAQHLGDDTVRVLDASWYLPTSGRDAQAEYRSAHIPGAQFFDIDEISDTSTDLPHMAPPPAKFASRMRGLGLGDGDQVVVYDGSGLFSAARVWWLFRLMGKPDVAVLDGGLPKWLAEGHAVDAAVPAVAARHFTPSPQNRHVATMADVTLAARSGTAAILDARSAARFAGDAPEPRPGLRGGHIPGSQSLAYTAVLAPDGTMKPVDALRRIFAGLGVVADSPVITTCGSGVTAAVLSLALARTGHLDHSLYDGSWSEWGGVAQNEVETGPGPAGAKE